MTITCDYLIEACKAVHFSPQWACYKNFGNAFRSAENTTFIYLLHAARIKSQGLRGAYVEDWGPLGVAARVGYPPITGSPLVSSTEARVRPSETTSLRRQPCWLVLCFPEEGVLQIISVTNRLHFPPPSPFYRCHSKLYSLLFFIPTPISLESFIVLWYSDAKSRPTCQEHLPRSELRSSNIETLSSGRGKWPFRSFTSIKRTLRC